MGWGNCGHDSRGRPIGYVFAATCDEPGCNAKIDRGLAYACGGMHGESIGCEDYFCGDHMHYAHDPGEGRGIQVCARCAANYEETRHQEYREMLLHVSGPDSTDKLKARRDVYMMLESWDDIDDLEIDEEAMSPALVQRLRQRSDFMASFNRPAPVSALPPLKASDLSSGDLSEDTSRTTIGPAPAHFKDLGA